MTGPIFDLNSLSSTPYIRKQFIAVLIEAPGSRQETELERMTRESNARIRRAELAAKANTVYMPLDNGEYIYYHKPTGRFVTPNWHGFDYSTIVLNKEEMQIAYKAFKERWPKDCWGESFYDLENNRFVVN